MRKGITRARARSIRLLDRMVGSDPEATRALRAEGTA
jgi:hypothetical protein